jgi:hypothetical protein
VHKKGGPSHVVLTPSNVVDAAALVYVYPHMHTQLPIILMNIGTKYGWHKQILSLLVV